MKDISVIIPVYNAENYLKDIIQDIKKQTITNYEIILVNDGSIDHSKEICNELVENEKNIRVIHQENQGPSVARNNGIKVSQGRYIIFLDADDNIPKNMFQLLYDSINTKNTDLAIGEYNVCTLYDEKIKNNITTKTPLNDMNGKEAIISGILSQNTTPIFNYLWNKIYVRDIIIKNDIKFEKSLRYAEDLLFNLTYLSHIDRISIVHESVYQYNKRNMINSLSNKLQNNIYENTIQIINWWKEFLQNYKVDEEKINKNISKQYINRIDLLLRKMIPYLRECNITEIINKIYNNEDIVNAYSTMSVRGINNKIIKFCISHKFNNLLISYLYCKSIIYKMKGAIR